MAPDMKKPVPRDRLSLRGVDCLTESDNFDQAAPFFLNHASSFFHPSSAASLR